MKNLFIINEDEKNRILGLHESATKNQYLVNEQVSSEKQIAGQIYTASYGAGTNEESFVNAIEKINSLEQLIAVDNLLKNGYSRLGLQGQINDEFNPQEYNERIYLDRIKEKLNSLGAKLTYDQIRNGSVVITYSKPITPQPQPQPQTDDSQKIVQTKPETSGTKSTQTQESPNVTRIKDLQRKVGVKDDGILGKVTLKAIMDKLSQ